jgi:hypothetical protein
MFKCTMALNGFQTFSKVIAQTSTRAQDIEMQRLDMKFTGLKSFLVFIVLAHAALWASESKNHLMTDPLMGLQYNPDSIKFESCPRWFDSRDGRVIGKEWIYAKCRQPNGTFYIYSGLFKLWNDQDEVWMDSVLEPDFGAVIKVTGRKIVELGTPDVLYGTKHTLPENAGKCLAEDAVKRYIKAFGSVSKLQKALTDKHVVKENLPKILVEALISGGLNVPASKKK